MPPKDGTIWYGHLAGKGFTQQEMLDAGLARQGQRGVYDYFRGRVTWPIRDSTGTTLGFGARKLYEDDAINAKYINTPDTQLYRKTQVLYGIDLAKSAIVKKRQAVIVEGYTDVMAMHLAGIDTAVATCGTAFGAEHAKIIRRLIADDSLGAVQLVGPLKVEGQALSSRVVFTFDGDAARTEGRDPCVRSGRGVFHAGLRRGRRGQSRPPATCASNAATKRCVR